MKIGDVIDAYVGLKTSLGMSFESARRVLDQFSREIGTLLAPVSVLQLGPLADGLERDWPKVNAGIEKHYGYAFQWFALSGLIAFLYGWFQIVRRFISPR